VFALKGIQSSESDEDAEDMNEDEDQEDEEENQMRPEVRTKRKGKAKAKPPPESEDEEESEEDEEEEESWGRKKSAYYSSNAAELDSEDEEANELEEQEAKRLQVKARDAMADDDFGLADIAQDGAEEVEEFVSLFVGLYLVTNLCAARCSNLLRWSRHALYHLTRMLPLDIWKRQTRRLLL
jgi:U3 small nucleolar RNA-associated protein 3